MVNLPRIRLDTTFAELFLSDGEINLPLFVPYYPNSDINFPQAFPRTRKYVYQTLDLAKNLSSTSVHESYRIDFMSISPQRDMFIAGNMPVAVFDAFDPPRELASRKDIIETLSVLSATQKPDLKFFSGPKELEESQNTSPLFLTMPASAACRS